MASCSESSLSGDNRRRFLGDCSSESWSLRCSLEEALENELADDKGDGETLRL